MQNEYVSTNPIQRVYIFVLVLYPDTTDGGFLKDVFNHQSHPFSKEPMESEKLKKKSC